jgi:hypothetical protein
MKNIKEKHKRSKLGEGRNYGIGFAILQPNATKTKFKTLNAFTACRDYLNDFSYVEFEKKEIGCVYGYNHKLLNCFDNKRLFYLGVNTLDFNNGGSWNLKEKATEILISNYKILEKLLNKFEEKKGLKTKSKITLDEDTLIIKAPMYWMKTTALISVYSLIIRCFFNISDFNDDTFIDILSKNKPFIISDNYMVQNCITFYNSELKFDKINYEEHQINSSSGIHNFGISSFLTKNK